MNKAMCFCLMLLGFIFSVPTFAQAAQEYEQALKAVKVNLSDSDAAKVRDWLMDDGSGYLDLAKELLGLLKGLNPKGTECLLDAIMGKYRIVKGKKASEYIAPPYDKEAIKKAYVKNWQERNSAMWNSFEEKVRNDYKLAFDKITKSY